MGFFEKFFGFHKQSDGTRSSYIGKELGNSFTDWRQVTWLIATPLLALALYRYFRSHPQHARTTIVVLSIIMISSRLIVHITPQILGDELFWEVLPFHLCSITSISMGVIALFDINKLKAPIYVLGMMGAITTIGAGETFIYSFINFYYALGIVSHTLLLLIPIIEIASGTFRLDLKQTPYTFGTLLLFMAWAMFANKVLLTKIDPNYMFLERNGLPGDFGGSWYFLVYIAIFFLIYAAIFVPVMIYRRKRPNGPILNS